MLKVFLLSIHEAEEILQEQSLDPSTVDLGDILASSVRHMGLPRSLREVGIHPAQFDLLAEHSLLDEFCKTNPVPLHSKDQVLEILQMVAV